MGSRASSDSILLSPLPRSALLFSLAAWFVWETWRAEPQPISAGHAALVAGLGSVVLATAWLSIKRFHPVWLVLFSVACIALGTLNRGVSSSVVVMLAIALAAVRWELRTALVFSALVAIAPELLQLVRGRPLLPVALGFSILGYAFVFMTGAGTRRIREDHRRMAALLAELQASREAHVEGAKLAERARLAREIHDVLAHTLSALNVQLEGVRLLLEERPGDPAALAAVERACGLAKGGLEEVRRAVGTLRGDRLPGPDLLPELVANFQRDSGTPCHFTVEGDPLALTPEAQLALYRTAQEALTNVRKHADAESVFLSLRYQRRGAELTVEDRGVARPTSGKPGYGLAGMRERAELLGGSLEASSEEHGFRVRLWVPA